MRQNRASTPACTLADLLFRRQAQLGVPHKVRKQRGGPALHSPSAAEGNLALRRAVRAGRAGQRLPRKVSPPAAGALRPNGIARRPCVRSRDRTWCATTKKDLKEREGFVGSRAKVSHFPEF